MLRDMAAELFNRKATRIFVYGSLKRGFFNSRRLQGQRFVGKAKTEPGYELRSLGMFPAMTESYDGGIVHGEIWDVDDDCLRSIDNMELGAGYFREVIRCGINGVTTGAAAYLKTRDRVSFYPIVPDGNWMAGDQPR